MKKLWITSGVFILCSLLLSQAARTADYPNVEPFMRFWRNLQRKVETGKVDLRKNLELRIKSDLEGRKVSTSDLKFEINENSPELLELLKEFLTAVDESNLLKVIALETYNEEIKSADLYIRFDESDIKFDLTLNANSEATARQIASRFNLLFKLTAGFVENRPEEEFYKNAQISSENDQIKVFGKISRGNLNEFLRNL